MQRRIDDSADTKGPLYGPTVQVSDQILQPSSTAGVTYSSHLTRRERQVQHPVKHFVRRFPITTSGVCNVFRNEEIYRIVVLRHESL
jgi:hypothetical protein